MLRIFLGENQNEKLGICAQGMRRQLEQGKKVMAIVPDQFSFAFDKFLYSQLGARAFNDVEILSFKRLSESLVNRFGTREGALISQSDRMILIWLALRKTKQKSALRLLNRSLDKPAFCEDISRLIDSFRRGGVTPPALRDAAETVGGTLRDKLLDVADIFDTYSDLLTAQSCRDESSVISEGARIAAENGIFKGTCVYIDRFDSFSPDEFGLLRAAIRDADNVTVSLPMPREYRRSAVSPFSHCEATQNLLVKLCAELNAPLEYSFCSAKKSQNELLESVGECLFSPICKAPKSDSSVRAVRADTLYEEAEFVAAEIRRLVTREGFKFNDIAVITHNIESYGAILEAAFERYGVEAFIDQPQTAAGMSLVIHALDAIEAATTKSPDTDKILGCLRSPFSPLSQEEVSVLWDYCVRWNVEKEMWLHDFTAGGAALLETVNEARKKAVEPLLQLHERSKNATAKEISEAFCDFLKTTQLAERAFSVIEDCTESDLKLETARLFKQLWSVVMSAVTSIYLTAGSERITLRAYGDLLRLILSQASVSNPPQKLDSVTVADVGRSIISQPKIAFVMGLADGVFPAEVRKSGLFSGRDIAELQSLGVTFDIAPESRLCAERFDCYKAITAPAERLYLSYSCADLRGKELKPSRFLRRIAQYCSVKTVRAADFGAELYCSTPAAAYYSYSVGRGCSEPQKIAIRDALLSVPEYREKLARLGSLRAGEHRLSPPVSQKLFAARDINVTASRIDVYNSCPYQYFCKYGLKIEEIRPLTVDPANRGTVMHFIFESVLRHFGSGFSDASDEEIIALVERLLLEFSEENLGGDFGKSAKFKADYNRLGGAAIEILFNMREEFKVSKFRPERFEYNLSRSDGESVLSIPISNGLNVNIRGVVDRVDTFTDSDGRRYLRVVDYKTGAKKLSFEDIYNGINLQLLLYILALTEGRDADFSDCVPGGVLYMRAGFLECKDDFDPLADEVSTRLRRTAEQLKRNGLVVDIPQSVEAMDEGFSGQFVPVKIKKDGSYTASSEVISEKSFRLLEDFAKQKVREFGKNLMNGRIDSLPVGDDPEHLACAYCDYSAVCDRKKYMMKLIGKADGELLAAEIFKKEADENV